MYGDYSLGDPIFTGCNDSNSTSVTAESSPATAESSNGTVEKSADSKILIVYFSRVGISEPFDEVDAVSSASLPNGNTIVIANDIKELTGGDMFQLITDKVYPADYNATTDLAQKEQKAKERPTLKSQPKNLVDYDIIFLGYPNWWGTIPTALFTFHENKTWPEKQSCRSARMKEAVWATVNGIMAIYLTFFSEGLAKYFSKVLAFL